MGQTDGGPGWRGSREITLLPLKYGEPPKLALKIFSEGDFETSLDKIL